MYQILRDVFFSSVVQREAKCTVDFTINGKPYTVSDDVPAGTTLNVYIRDFAKLRGTKFMCLEGGCGACIVAAEIKGQTISVNSCLVPVVICNGWAIKTIEGIGDKKTGYHSIQATLAEMNGSQCGYCSPGMVMNLYSLIKDKSLTMKEIENSFGSNICRCTGYRPILDAFKAFASDAPPKVLQQIKDIEELYDVKTCPKSGLPCKGTCEKSENGEICEKSGNWEKAEENTDAIFIKLRDAEFHKVLTIDSLFEVFDKHTTGSYVLNGGNTAHGVYRMQKADIYIDINDIPDLHRIEKDKDSLIFGGNVSLTLVIETFLKYSEDEGFKHLRAMARHVDLIASVPIRNIGTIAGNLMIKHEHNEFPSDVFLIFETAGAQIHILEGPGKKSSMTLLEFLKLDMKRKIIYSIVIPALSSEYVYRSYKIMPRAQNAHAQINAGFLLKLDSAGQVLEKPNIIFGGIRKDFLHALKTEEYLMGKKILEENVLSKALETLDGELHPDHVLPEYSPEFRKLLAKGLFYKAALSIKPETLNSRIQSGATILERDLSSGWHDYDTDKNIWPLNKPIPKIEAIYQTSGEAQYVNDLPPFPGEVYCAFALTTVANGKIQSIDAQEALEMEGVIGFFSAKDVPGKNRFVSSTTQHFLLQMDELLFAEEDVQYSGQPVGVVVACSNKIANDAAQKVKITYTDSLKTKPIITINDAIASNDQSRIVQMINIPASKKGNNVQHVIQGEFGCGLQYHFTMEPQTCVCIPIEDGMDVYASTQWMDLLQCTIAVVLDVKNNSINMKVRRLGGAYGSKISRTNLISCACALVCHKLNRPTRFIATIESNMQAFGKRPETRQHYEVGVDENGLIQYANWKYWSNSGAVLNETCSLFAANHLFTCYDGSTWDVQGFEARTDIPPNTWCRAPGSTEGIAMAENMMEHIAKCVGKDPVEVRLINMIADDRNVLEPMIHELKRISDYDSRKTSVDAFNRENRWKKKGISLIVMKYPLMYIGGFYSLVSIYARDGTVSITHGGIESGQGINTKIAQVAAHILGIDLSFVTVKPSDNLTSPNNFVTGGSMTSDVCAYATMMACKELNKRLEPIKQQLTDPTWQEITMAAYAKEISLSARYMYSAMNDDVKPYAIYGATIAEVEVDVLTGQHLIHRVDIVEDVGVSMSPEIDLGQVEGAFVMGIGYWTSEDLVYDPTSGFLTNDRTWNYKPPGAKDIPVNFRVSFRRNAPNPLGVLRSKATGEPPLCMSFVIPLAIRQALNSARTDSGNNDVWYELDGPVTTERILLTSLTSSNGMTL